jgi:hypothetical protein
MVLLLALLATLLVPRASLASNQPGTFVTMTSEPGDFVGQGQHRFFHPSNSSVTITGSRQPSETSLAVRKRQRRVRASGIVTPEGATGAVAVQLTKKVAGSWVEVATKDTILDDEGSYAVRFTRPQRPKCRLLAYYGGDDVYKPSRIARKFRC